MPVIVVASPKGGVGKSTLATNVAGYLASQGHAVLLGDVDRQQSARLWLSLRSAQATPIGHWEAETENSLVKPPRGTPYAVLDTPAGLHGWRFKDALALADKVLVPMQPSIFDIYAVREFLDRLLAQRRAAKVQIGLVAMRSDTRTVAAERLREFMAGLSVPVVGELRDTQNYVQLAAGGLSLFDVAPGRVQRDLDQWEPLRAWLDA